MLYGYMKKLVVNGGGTYHVSRIGAETEEGLGLKRDMYMEDDWAVATEEEYDAQNAPKEEVAEEVQESVEPTVEEVKEETQA